MKTGKFLTGTALCAAVLSTVTVSGGNMMSKADLAQAALADSLIELDILRYCVINGCEWETDYKVYRTIPRKTEKEYIVIDAEGTTHTFPYTAKRKISGQDGVRLTIKK